MKKFHALLLCAFLLFGTHLASSQELHTQSNAVSIANEANATTGWTGSSTITSDTSDPYGSGTYALKIVSTSNNTNDRRVSYNFTVVNGETYDISIWAKQGSQSNDPAFALWSGFSNFSTTAISGTTWTEYTFTLTANATSATIIAFTGSSGGGSTGDELYLDHVSITQQGSSDTQAPTAPTVTSSGNTATTVDLSWSGATDNVGVTAYDVYQDGTVVGNDITTTTYQATGLTASTSYDFKVRAIDAAGNESPDSNVLSVTTGSASDTQAPTAPTVSSTGNTDTTVDLSWSGATDNVGVTAYDVYQGGTVVGNNITTTTYQATGLTASTSYDFKVRAIDAAGNESVDSNIISVTTNAASGGGTSVWTESGATASYTGEVAVGVSTVPSGYKMAVDGKLITEEVRVELSGTWPDYVFEEDYDLPTLEEIQQHIAANGHLPNIPSAKEIEAEGIQLGEMNKLLLEKIEELTLYIIKQEERISILENQNCRGKD